MTEETIFAKAIEIEDADKRRQFLDEVCEGDLELRNRLEALLSAKNQNDSLLDQPISFRDELTKGANVRHFDIESQIGPYKILQKIGEGGFGIVYMAERKRPMRKRVALKVIKPGMDSKAVVARFEAERQALAMMDHPNIARILDGGETDAGRPYFVMDLVKGVPITEFCDANKLTTRERLELFKTVCQAVQHAHQKGIIHRDIKPSNILVTLIDGKPMPKVIDFGVAKALYHELTDKTYFTQFGQMIGTLQYMSPEQAEMSAVDIDTRSDIYSLGVVLYQLLTGGTPISGERLKATGYAEIQRIIREEEPPKPSTRLSTLGEKLTMVAKHRKTDESSLRKNIAGELDWIVMKTLDKERGRRYETANELATDVENFLQDLPVNARPPSRSYLIKKFARRHKAAFSIAIGVFSFVVLAAVGAGIAALVANHYRQLAVENRQLAVENETTANQLAQQRAREKYESDTYAAAMSYDENNIVISDQLLLRNLPLDGEVDHRGIEWYLLWNLCHPMRNVETIKLDDNITAADTSPSGRYVAVAFPRTPARIIDFETGKTVADIADSRQSWSNRIRFFNSDFEVLHISKDKKSAIILNWNTETTTTFSDPKLTDIIDVCASKDGSIVVATGKDATVIWKLDEMKKQVGEPSVVLTTEGRALGMSDNKQYLVVCDQNRNMTIWDLKLNRLHKKLSEIHDLRIWALDISNDSRLVATASMDHTVRIWDIATGERKATLNAHSDQVRNVQFSPTNDNLLASSGRSDEVYLWDLATYSPIKKFRAYSNGHVGCFSPDGQRFFVEGKWHLARWEFSQQPVDAIGGVTWCRTVRIFDDNGKIAALKSPQEIEDQMLVVFDAVRGTPLKHPFDRQKFLCMDMSQCGICVLGNASGDLIRWDSKTGKVDELHVVDDPNTNSVTAVAIDPANVDQVAFGCSDGSVFVGRWSESNFEQLKCHIPQERIRRLQFTGHALISADDGTSVSIWDIKQKCLGKTFNQHDDWTWAIAVSKGGSTVATGSWDQTIKIWDIATGEVKHTIEDIFDVVHGIAFVDNDQTIVAATSSGTIRFYDVDSGQLKVRFESHRDSAYGLAVSPDEKLIVSSGRRDGLLRIWRVADKKTVDHWLDHQDN